MNNYIFIILIGGYIVAEIISLLPHKQRDGVLKFLKFLICLPIYFCYAPIRLTIEFLKTFK